MAYTISGGASNQTTTIVLPPTTDFALVFHLDQDTKKFDKGFYSAALTDGRASSEMIHNFLSEVEGTFKDKLKWLRRLKAYLLFSLITGLMVMLAYTFVVVSGVNDDSYSSYTNNNNHYNNADHHTGRRENLRHSKRHHYDPEEEVDTLCLIWFGAIINSMIWCGIFRLVSKYSVKKARKGVQATVDKNQYLFANYGLRWNLPLAFPHYIELWKDYKGQNCNQGNTLPLVNYNPFQNQHQNQPQSLPQKYPNLNQVVDPQIYFDFQNNGLARQLSLNQAQRNDGNNYVPPYNMNI